MFNTPDGRSDEGRVAGPETAASADCRNLVVSYLVAMQDLRYFAACLDTVQHCVVADVAAPDAGLALAKLHRLDPVLPAM
jgi:hypothetical protein